MYGIVCIRVKESTYLLKALLSLFSSEYSPLLIITNFVYIVLLHIVNLLSVKTNTTTFLPNQA